VVHVSLPVTRTQEFVHLWHIGYLSFWFVTEDVLDPFPMPFGGPKQNLYELASSISLCLSQHPL
ncbi:hypothetical protein ACJX0J_031704, partial [Zea mays]